MATIHDVAKQAGVSTATVSRSFTKGHVLNEATRKRVVDAADLLNYRPRRSAANKAVLQETSQKQSSVSIGFQFLAYNSHDTVLGNDFYGPVLTGAQAEADALGMHLMLHTMYRNRISNPLPPMISEQAVAGMLLVGTADSSLMKTFEQYVPHIVLVDDRDMSGKHDCIYSDGFGGAVEAVDHLLSLGHRRIGFLTNSSLSAAFDDRLNGYICSLYKAGIAVDPDLICKASESDDPAEKNISVADIARYLRSPNRPTAVFAVNDAHALALLHTCRHLNISVPSDLSVVGFDDVDFSAHTFPPLTTVRVDKHLLGRMSVRRLTDRLKQSSASQVPLESGVRIEVPTKLIKRNSTSYINR